MRGLLLTLGALLVAVQSASAGGALRVGMDTRSPPCVFVPGLDYSKEDSRKDPAVTEAVRADDGRIKTLGDMAGKIVGHFQSEVVERTLRAVGASQLRVYDVQEKLFADLKAGVVDAALYDSPYVRWNPTCGVGGGSQARLVPRAPRSGRTRRPTGACGRERRCARARKARTSSSAA